MERWLGIIKHDLLRVLLLTKTENRLFNLSAGKFSKHASQNFVTRQLSLG